MFRKSPATVICLFFSLAGAIALSIESYLTIHNKSLCQTKACEIVGHYLTIGEPLLIAGGALFLWVFTAALFFAGRYPDRLKNTPYYLLALALSIDSSLIGFQYFIIQQKCALCITVAALLLVLTILYCSSQKNYLILCCFLLLWVGGFGVHKIITMPAPQGAFNNMVLYKKDVAPTSAKSHQPQMTFIFSMNCPHCLKVVEYLAENNSTIDNFRLASVDTDKESINKLSFFLKKASNTSNPFTLLKEIKENNTLPSVSSDNTLGTKNQNSLNYLSNIGIATVPVLVIQNSNYKLTILLGSEKILNYLKDTSQK